MLRTGYSSAAVLQELTKRKCADAPTAEQETQLLRAGASPDLIAALKSGIFAISADEAAKFQRQQEIDAKNRAAAVAAANKYSAPNAVQRPKSRGGDTSQQKTVYDAVKGDLVSFRNGGMTHFDDSALENKRLFLIYFSAHWCGPCRKFTPSLVDYYNNTLAKHPEFDVIFVSRDRSPFGMETYMREASMPWPAIDFQKIAGKANITRYEGRGIPDLVLVDGSGKVLADSYNGEEYVGPSKVLEALDRMLAMGPGSEIAVR